MTRGTAKVYKPALGKKENGMAVREHILVNLRLDIDLTDAFVCIQRINLYFVVKVPYVADDGLVLHLLHVFNGDDVTVACCSDEYVSFGEALLYRPYLEAFHCSLECTDRINLGHNDPGAIRPH